MREEIFKAYKHGFRELGAERVAIKHGGWKTDGQGTTQLIDMGKEKMDGW